MEEKTLHNTTESQAKDNVSDLEVWGNGDTWRLICKASSKKQGWMKSTKALEVPGVGCFVQVTTQQLNDTGVPVEVDGGTAKFTASDTYKESAIAEAVTFAPGVKIEEITDEEGNVVDRKLVNMWPTPED